MEEIKCPLCGNPLKLSTIENKGQLHFFACYKCNYQLRMSPSKDFALEYAKEFISKFPPIMRVKVGDKVEVLETGNKSLISEVRQVRVKQGVIAVIGSRRLYNTIDVFRWPWELERKGGEEQ